MPVPTPGRLTGRDVSRSMVHNTGEEIMRRVTMAAVLVWAGVLSAAPALAQGKWSSLKAIPQGEEEVYGTAIGGRLYVLGGLGVFPGWEPKQMLWSFDPATS